MTTGKEEAWGVQGERDRGDSSIMKGGMLRANEARVWRLREQEGGTLSTRVQQ